jgi:hypothetical protein
MLACSCVFNVSCSMSHECPPPFVVQRMFCTVPETSCAPRMMVAHQWALPLGPPLAIPRVAPLGGHLHTAAVALSWAVTPHRGQLRLTRPPVTRRYDSRGLHMLPVSLAPGGGGEEAAYTVPSVRLVPFHWESTCTLKCM